MQNYVKSMGCSKSSSKREVYSNRGLSQETRKISNKHPDIPHKRIILKKSKFSRKKEIIKIRDKINKIEIKNRKKSIKPRTFVKKR